MYTGDVLRPGPKEQVHIGPGKCMCQAGRGDLRVVTCALEGQVGCCEGAEKEGRALPMEALAWDGQAELWGWLAVWQVGLWEAQWR